MTTTNFELVAQVRDDLGKSASRRLRRAEKVLGVVYGGGEAATSITLEQRNVVKALENEAVYSHILGLTINGKRHKVVLRDIQRHPYRAIILHMDFMRVKDTDLINMKVPVHFIGGEKCPGVLESGGIINHLMSEIEIRCQANKLPEFIQVDISELKLNDSIHVSQLHVPEGVELVMLTQGHDLVVVSVHLPKQTKLDEEEAAEEAAAAAAAAEAAAAEATAAGVPAATEGATPATTAPEAEKGKEKDKGQHGDDKGHHH